MKKLFYFLIVLVAGYFLYAKCGHKESKDPSVLKQVKVAVKTANLRTGPGTNYDFVLDANGAKQQVNKGTILDVVAEKRGWYEIRLQGDSTRIAYIKQTLCSDLNSHSSGSQNSKQRPPKTTPAADPTATSSGSSDGYHISTEPVSPPVSNPDDEVVEEVTTGGGSEDEVIF